MARPPRIGSTFASRSPTSTSSGGGGYTDVRGATGIAPPPGGSSNASPSTGGFSSVSGESQQVTPGGQVVSSEQTGGFSSASGEQQEVTPQGRVVRSVKIQQARSPQAVTNQVTRAPEPETTGAAVITPRNVAGQAPYSQRLDKVLERTNPNYLLIRNALNEAGLKANKVSVGEAQLAVERYLARRGQGNVSLASGGVGNVQPVPASFERKPRVTTARAPQGAAPVSVAVPASTPASPTQEPDSGLFGNVGRALYGQFAGLQNRGAGVIEGLPIFGPLFTIRATIPREQRGRFDVLAGEPTAAGITEFAGTSLVFGGLGRAFGFGASRLAGIGAPVAETIATRAPAVARVASAGGRAVSRIPGPVRTAAIYGTGGALEFYGATATQSTKKSEAKAAVFGGTQSQRERVLETYQEETIGRGLTGRVVEQAGETGEVVARSTEAPVVGDESLVGVGQRFALGGVPGLTSFFVPESVKREAAKKALKSQGLSVSEKNIQDVISRGEAVGQASTIGLFASETGSELIGSQLIRGGSPAIRAARTPGKQAVALGVFTVPRIAAVGAIEGTSQTINVEQLTRTEPGPGRILFGAGFGAASAGAFTALQSLAIPYGGGRAVQAAGYGFDFPGEPIGDIAESAISRAGRRGPGLRVPVLTGTPSVTPSASKKTTRPGGRGRRTTSSIYDAPRGSILSGVRTPTRSVTIAGVKTPVDEFGLPAPGIDVTTGTNTTVGPQVNPFTDIPSETQGTTETQADTEVTAPTTGVGAPAFVSVPSIVPNRFPFIAPGRLGAGEGRASGSTRLGYFDELAAALTGLNPRSGEPIKQSTGKPIKQSTGKQRRRALKQRRSSKGSAPGRPARRDILRVYDRDTLGLSTAFGLFRRRR